MLLIPFSSTTKGTYRLGSSLWQNELHAKIPSDSQERRVVTTEPERISDPADDHLDVPDIPNLS